MMTRAVDGVQQKQRMLLMLLLMVASGWSRCKDDQGDYSNVPLQQQQQQGSRTDEKNDQPIYVQHACTQTLPLHEPPGLCGD